MWYLDTLSKFFGLDTEWLKALGLIHKYIRSITLNHFGAESLRERFLPRIEESARETLRYWSTQPSVEVKDSAAAVCWVCVKSIYIVTYIKLNVNISQYLLN